MDHPADIVVARRVPSFCEKLWATGEEMVDSLDSMFPELTSIIGGQVENLLEPIREKSSVFCCKNNPLVVIIQDASFQPFKRYIFFPISCSSIRLAKVPALLFFFQLLKFFQTNFLQIFLAVLVGLAWFSSSFSGCRKDLATGMRNSLLTGTRY